jgi:DnaJ-class molecular chaperone
VVVDAPCQLCDRTGVRKRAAFFPSGCTDTHRPVYESTTCSVCNGTGKIRARRAKP